MTTGDPQDFSNFKRSIVALLRRVLRDFIQEVEITVQLLDSAFEQ